MTGTPSSLTSALPLEYVTAYQGDPSSDQSNSLVAVVYPRLLNATDQTFPRHVSCEVEMTVTGDAVSAAKGVISQRTSKAARCRSGKAFAALTPGRRARGIPLQPRENFRSLRARSRKLGQPSNLQLPV